LSACDVAKEGAKGLYATIPNTVTDLKTFLKDKGYSKLSTLRKNELKEKANESIDRIISNATYMGRRG